MGDYIGNKPSFQTFPENTKDDLIPFGLNDISGTGTTFLLSQEVPGGYEGNVMVVVNNVIQDLESSYTIGGTGATLNREITFTEALTPSDVAYVIHRGNATHNFVPAPNSVTPESLAFNLRNFVIDKFNDTTTPEVDGVNFEFPLSQTPAVAASVLVTVTEPGSHPIIQTIDDANVAGVNGDYRLSGEVILNVDGSTGPYTIGETIDVKQGVTVIGRGRLLSFDANSLTIQSEDGVFIGADNVEGQTSTETNNLDSLTPVVEGPRNVLQFITPPIDDSQIRVLHLGFSTVSRRSNLTEVGVPPGGVGTAELANGSVTTPKLADGAVTNVKIANDTIQGTKILLNNNQFLRGKLFSGTVQNILAILTDDFLSFRSAQGFRWRSVATDILELTSTVIKPLVDNTLDLGASGERFKDAYIAGNIDIDGNILMQASQTVDGVDVSELKSDFDDAVANGGIIPAGTIAMWPSDTPPTGWLLCNGSSIVAATYPNLAAAIGTKFGGTVSNPNLPNFQQRFPIGKNFSGSPSTVGNTGGTWNHTHTIPLHDHDVVDNITMPAHTHNASGGSLSGTYNHKHRIDRHHHTTTHEHFIRGHGHAAFGQSGTKSMGIRPSSEYWADGYLGPNNHATWTTNVFGRRDLHRHTLGCFSLNGLDFTSSFTGGTGPVQAMPILHSGGLAGASVAMATDLAAINFQAGFAGNLAGAYTSGSHGHDPFMFFGRVGASGPSQGASNVGGGGSITVNGSQYLATGAVTQASAEDGDFGRATAGLNSGSFNSTNAIVSTGGSTVSGFAATDNPDSSTVNITSGATGAITGSAPNIGVNTTSGTQNQGSQNTGSANPPFLVVNFIIKHD